MSVDLTSEVSLEAATDLSEGAAFCGAAFDVGAGAGVHSHAGDDGHVEGPVQAAITASIDAVPNGVARGGGDRIGAGEAGERGLRSDASQVGPGGQCDGGGDRPDAGLVKERACWALAHQICDPLRDVLEVGVEGDCQSVVTDSRKDEEVPVGAV